MLRKLDICAQKEVRYQSFSTYEINHLKLLEEKWGDTLRYQDRQYCFYNKIPTAQQHKQNQPNGITLTQESSASRVTVNTAKHTCEMGESICKPVV